MTLQELKERVDHCFNRGYGDLIVCIPNNKSGYMGGTPVTKLKFAHQGTDWDKGKFLLFPEKQMVELIKNNESSVN